MGKAGSRSVRFGECGMPRPRRVCNVAVGSCHLSIHVARSQWFAVSQRSRSVDPWCRDDRFSVCTILTTILYIPIMHILVQTRLSVGLSSARSGEAGRNNIHIGCQDVLWHNYASNPSSDRVWEPSDLVRSGVTCELLKLGGADLHAVRPTYLMLHDTKGHSAHQPPSIHCQSRDTTIVSL